MNIQAKFPDRCDECGQRIHIGDPVTVTRFAFKRFIEHQTCPAKTSDPEEHTDRMARHMEEDADIARLNALMGGL